MILNPAIIALLTVSLLISTFAIYAAVIGFDIVRFWDIRDGGTRQLMLERKTYLVSTIFSYLLIFELLSLFLFVYTADDMHGIFVGAMCAAGSLNVNAFGYPTLVIKIFNFLLCGIWLIVNHTDNQGFDYPMIRPKYKFLMGIAVMLLLEAWLQLNYFKHLQANVITSCCGTLFSENAVGVAGVIAGLPSYPAKILFYLSVVLMLRTGIHYLVTGRSARIFAAMSVWLLLFSIVALISFIGVYFYELPTHHCPFCLLQGEYHFVGYPLYLSLLTAGITGGATGVIDGFKNLESLKTVIPGLQKKLCIVSMVGFVIFTLISTYPMIFSDFRLEGY
ncbi:MAG: hypothetical protein ABFS43_20310 [Thermodesulfobacteriota bacterium]